MPSTDSMGYEVLVNFPHGAAPNSSLTLATDGKLYGVTAFERNYLGGMFRYDLNTNTYPYPGYFNDIGYRPTAGVLQASDGMLYSATTKDLTYNELNLYSYNIQTDSFEKKISLIGANGIPTGNDATLGTFTEYKSIPVIFKHPQAQSTCVGSKASFSVSAGGYQIQTQWQKSTDMGITFTDINNATNAVYSFQSTISDSNTYYRAILIDSFGSDTSAIAKLTVYTPPAVDTLNAVICQGQSFPIGTDLFWQEGSFRDTIKNGLRRGCDSIVILNLSYLVDTSCIVYEGISNDRNQYFKLYPNPNEGEFIIENNHAEPFNIDVINILGEKVKEFSLSAIKKEFNISDVAPGMYNVIIKDDRQQLQVIKIVKE
jgi:hypothetical protein